LALIEAGGKPYKMSLSYEECKVGDSSMSAILDWVCKYTYTLDLTVVRHRHSSSKILVTLVECLKIQSGEWHYEENDGYDGWEAQQIAEAENEYHQSH